MWIRTTKGIEFFEVEFTDQNLPQIKNKNSCEQKGKIQKFSVTLQR